MASKAYNTNDPKPVERRYFRREGSEGYSWASNF